jgi:predicted DNA-binding helix-hairpin-helix protein
MRFYGYDAREIATGGAQGMLDLEIDPKLAWALANRAAFPVDLNRAPRALLLRVPGLGPRTVDRLLAARRVRRIRLDDLLALKVPARKAMPFVVADGHVPHDGMDSQRLRTQLLTAMATSAAQRTHSGMRVAPGAQASLF